MFSFNARTPSLSLVLLAAVSVGCKSPDKAPPVGQASASVNAAKAPKGPEVEKETLKLGFIKLTDCAPLIIAKEKGFFDDEGLDVTLEAQANWKILLDRVIAGEIDGAHMLAGQPIGATVGFGTKADVVTAFTLDLNGNAITVSNAVWAKMQEADAKLKSPTVQHPISAEALLPAVKAAKDAGTPLKFGMVFPVSTHNYELRYWLAAAGINPGAYTAEDTTGTKGGDVQISVTPPPQMPATLEAGTINGYSVGEPWNQQAVAKGIGVPVITNQDIVKNKQEKVFGVTRAWAEKNPKTHVAVVKALLRAGRWLDESLEHREEAAKLLAQKQYVGADVEVIRNSMTGHFFFQKTDKRAMPDFNIFYRYHANQPFYSDAVWYLTQMRRWGQIPEAKPAAWYAETAKRVYLPAVFFQAAKALVAEGKFKSEEFLWDSDGFRPPSKDFIDGIEFDGKDPLGYLKKHKLGNKE